MNLIALILGLILERLLTRSLHLRELRFLDGYYDWALRRLGVSSGLPAVLLAALLCALPVLPVIAVALAFGEHLFGIPYVLFAAFVLVFSLGPRDLGREVHDYCAAAEASDEDVAARIEKELTESDVPRDARRRIPAVEEAIFVQANNRIFGVIFWFLLLGPAGAWAFRVLDLLRRRAMFEAGREPAPVGAEASRLDVVRTLHGLVAWIPARLMALGYALAGSFDDAIRAWGDYGKDGAERFFEVSEELVAVVGRSATVRAESGGPGPRGADAVRASMGLVRRTLFLWVTAIALMTLFGWAL